MTLYRLSRIVPVRFSSLHGVQITERQMDEGGHGNHVRSGEHYDARLSVWWQWRDRILRHREQRICCP